MSRGLCLLRVYRSVQSIDCQAEARSLPCSYGLLLTIFTAIYVAATAHAQDNSVAFEKGDGEMKITVGGKMFATYVWNDPRTTRPYFKQVRANDGTTQLTRNHPPQQGDFDDHETFHPGIWWGFGDVGGNDYWRMKAKIIGGNFVAGPTGGPGRGTFTVRNQMLKNGSDEVFCQQLCRFTILSRPAGILLLCESTFTRDEGDFWLGDQEEMGISTRVATPIAVASRQGGVIRDSAGRTELRQIRTNQSDWCDYSGPIAGKHGGIMLMNDPQNFRRPWWHAVDTGLLIANPLGESELNGRGKRRQNVLVKKGQPFYLRYGVLVHLHERAEEFKQVDAYRDFLQQLPPRPKVDESNARNDLPQVPEGFRISIFAQEPMVYKPTSICFDRRGRLMVGQGPQYPRHEVDSPTDSVLLITDTNGDGKADSSKVFAEGFNSIQGLAWKGNDLYVANAPELTIVRDLDGDDEADQYVVVYSDLGNREHALHGLNWGPDGKLYMSKGNSKGHNQPEKYGAVAPRAFRELWDVVHPPGAPDAYPLRVFEKEDYRKTYHHWDDDWGREGGVLRCDPLGANLEIVSRGMRNPWDIAMDDGFHWLGTDNDQAQGDRIIMPFWGAHFGWGHTYSSHWTGEDHLPTAPMSGPVFHGSGAGIIFYAHPHFPPEYRGAFFINDWSAGTFVYRPQWEGALMQPAGGSWQPFARRGKGDMLYRPTDLEFGPDGSVYICGWGGDYHYDPGTDGSWMFRVTHDEAPASVDDWRQPHRERAITDWPLEELIADLGPDRLPVWRIDALDEIIRRGTSVRDRLQESIDNGSLSRGQRTWALWALGRLDVTDPQVDRYLANLVPERPAPNERAREANTRIQAIRLLAFRWHAREESTDLPAAVLTSLNDAEPRIRFAAVQALRQTRQHVARLVDQLATERDRLVFYAGWNALPDMLTKERRKQLLTDRRPQVRRAGLLSLLEKYELTLDEVVAIAERDEDPGVQQWAMTWALNPRPPKKMPNSKVRIELEQSVAVGQLIERAQQADNPRIRGLYLTMISRAVYRERDWARIHEFYESLREDAERALVLTALAKMDRAKPVLMKALGGGPEQRREAVRRLIGLAHTPGNSPPEIANFVVEHFADPGNPNARQSVIDVLFGLDLVANWRPPNGWDTTLVRLFRGARDSESRRKILRILSAVETSLVTAESPIRDLLRAASREQNPLYYSTLVALNQTWEVRAKLKPPQVATLQGVQRHLDSADPARGRELFFGRTGATACTTCHRMDGRGTNLGPDLSGVAVRAKPDKIIESLLSPSATITEGYHQQTLLLHSGVTLSGAVLSETSSELRLLKADGTVETVPAAAIDQRTKTNVSIMPTGYELLGDRQIADIVAFLMAPRNVASSE